MLACSHRHSSLPVTTYGDAGQDSSGGLMVPRCRGDRWGLRGRPPPDPPFISGCGQPLTTVLPCSDGRQVLQAVDVRALVAGLEDPVGAHPYNETPQTCTLVSERGPTVVNSHGAGRRGGLVEADSSSGSVLRRHPAFSTLRAPTVDCPNTRRAAFVTPAIRFSRQVQYAEWPHRQSSGSLKGSGLVPRAAGECAPGDTAGSRPRSADPRLDTAVAAPR